MESHVFNLVVTPAIVVIVLGLAFLAGGAALGRRGFAAETSWGYGSLLVVVLLATALVDLGASGSWKPVYPGPEATHAASTR